MANAAIKKLTNWFRDPAWAPVTEPLKMIGNSALAPNVGFLDALATAFESDYEQRPFLARYFKSFSDSDSFPVNLTGTLGALLGGIASGVVAGAAFASSGVLVTGMAAVAAFGIGAVATPLAVMAALGFAGAAVGCVAAPFGVAKGIYIASRHHAAVKQERAAQAKLAVAENEPPCKLPPSMSPTFKGAAGPAALPVVPQPSLQADRHQKISEYGL